MISRGFCQRVATILNPHGCYASRDLPRILVLLFLWKKPTQRLRLDELLPIIGEFGRFQITFDIALCILQAPGIMLIFLPYFSQHNPPWKCVANSSTCLLNGTFSLASKSYEARCQMSRSEWEYTEAKEYSVVTQVRVFKANFSDHIPNFLRSDSNKMSQEISGNAKLLMQLY